MRGKLCMRRVRWCWNKINGKCWKNSQYFTQHLLPDYMDEYPDKTANWDVVFDARGHLREPHTGLMIGLGTLEVRRYIGQVGRVDLRQTRRDGN
jgi:hypothetical protein